MTHSALTAELAALDRNEAQIRSGEWTAIERDGRTVELLLEGIAARRARLNQLSADLDSKQVTAKQMARYPVLSPRENAHESNSKAWDLSQEAGRLDTADKPEPKGIERYPSESSLHSITELSGVWTQQEAGRYFIPAKLGEESHAE